MSGLVCALPIAVGPHPARFVDAAVAEGGGEVVGIDADPVGLVWIDSHDVDGLRKWLAGAPTVRWVQLPSAGVERIAQAGMFDAERVWTCTKGSYGPPVAEHALALLLAGLRDLPARIEARSWGRPSGTSLFGQQVTVLGGGGIARSLLDLLAPFDVRTTVVRRSGSPLAGAHRTVTTSELPDVLPGSLAVVVALALTPETRRIIDRSALERMDERAWLVNVGRGQHVDTDALVDALASRRIAGAALDVTDPEPLPDGHPLWGLPNCIVTPHTANTFEMALPLLAERVRTNVERLKSGEPLVGQVDPRAGY